MAEIKYSEILAANEVTTAGTNDIIVLAIVDGGSPTGYTSKAIKAGNLINWQLVMDLGSTALDIASDAILVTDEFKVDFKSKKDEDKEARLIMDYFVKTELSFTDYIAGSNLMKIDAAGILIQDELALKGAFYADDYSPNFTALSLITKGYADTNLGGSSLNPIFVNPSGFEEGYVPSWDDSAQEYVLSPNLNGIYTGDGSFAQDANAALNGFSFIINSLAGVSTTFDGAGNIIMDGSTNEIQVGRSAIDATLPNGGIVIKPDADLGNGARFGTIRGVSGTAFDNDVTTFILTSDWEKGTIFELNQGGVLAGKFETRVGGVVFDSGDFDILGNLKIVDGTQGNIGDVWTSTDALGNGAWVAGGGGGGNTLYTADDNIGAGRVATLTDTINFSGGNFGIGITPTSRLHVVGGDVKFQGSTDSNLFVLDHSSDNVAIGQFPSPVVKFGVKNSTSEAFVFSFATSGTGSLIMDNTGNVVLNANDLTMRGLTDTIDIFRVSQASGYVGVGGVGLSRFSVVGGDVRFEGAAQTLLSTNYNQNGVGLGFSTPTLDTVHSKTLDIQFEGATDTNLFRLDEFNNVISIGVIPSANYKFRVKSTTKWAGLYVSNSGTPISSPQGLYAECTSASTTSSTAIYGISAGSTGNNIGGEFLAFQTTVGNGIGVRSTAIRTTTGTNYALYLEAENSGSPERAYAIFAESGHCVFNQQLENWDFQIGSDLSPNMFHLKGSTNNIGIRTATPDASAIIDFTSTTQGVLMPRMTGGQANAITPVDGLIVYVTSASAPLTQIGFWGYVNGAWTLMA